MKNDITFFKVMFIGRSEAQSGSGARLLAMQRMSQEVLEDGARYLQAIIVGISQRGWEVQVLGSIVEHPAFHPINK